MAEAHDVPEAGASDEPVPTGALVAAVLAAIEAGDRDRLIALVADLHAADEADLLELLPAEARRGLIRLIGDTLGFKILTELDQSLRNEILARLEPARIAEAIRELDSDDAVYLLEDLEEGAREDILSRLPPPDRAALRRSLDYAENSAGRLMQTDFVAVPPFWTVGQTIDHMRDADELPDDFYEIFVVDPAFHLLGTVPLSRLLRTRRPVRIEDIVRRDSPVIRADEDQERVAYAFAQYNLVSAAVVDEDGRIVGVVTIDDVVDVIREEGEEDIRGLARVGDEELTDTVWRTTRSRFAWLAVSLVNAFFAAVVISFYDATIAEMVALAVLMPIVASMGGNAATQTMTVAVRAIAARALLPVNALRVIGRELMVGMINGVLFAVIVGGIAALWFANAGLGLIVGAALIVNMFVAGLVGITVPLALERFGVDPAIASSPFVIATTDVVGFFAFLGLAAWLLL